MLRFAKARRIFIRSLEALARDWRRHRAVRTAALPLWLLLAVGIGQSARLPIHIYTVLDGLPRKSTSCLVPSAHGIMWFCTSEGLVRFDGRSFRTFGPEQGLPSRNIRDLVVSRSEGYWVITDRGLCRMQPTARVGEPCGLFKGPSWQDWRFGCSVLELSTGEIWASDNTRLYKVDQQAQTLNEEPTPS